METTNSEPKTFLEWAKMEKANFDEKMEQMKEKNKKAMPDKIKLIIVYLFLSTGKRLTEGNYLLFEEVGKTYIGYSGMRGDVIEECEKVLAEANDEFSRFKKITEYFINITGVYNVISNRRILWILVSLINQVRIKSDEHQKLIDLWIDKNKIDSSIVLEMHDTYQTQQAMVEYDKWLETNKDISYLKGSSINKELNKNLLDLEQSVNTLITFG